MAQSASRGAVPRSAHEEPLPTSLRKTKTKHSPFTETRLECASIRKPFTAEQLHALITHGLGSG